MCRFLHFFDTVTWGKYEEKSEMRISKSSTGRRRKASLSGLTVETNTTFQMSKILHRMPYGKNKLGTNPSSRKATKDRGHKGEFKVKRQREKSKRKDWP